MRGARKRLAVLTLAAFSLIAWGPAQAADPAVYAGDLPWVSVRDTGAKGDGVADDTDAIRAAIARAPVGGEVLIPAGSYRVTGPITITKPLMLAGVGRGSQLYQSTDGANLLVLRDVQGAVIRDLYLGSASTTPGTSLILLENSHRNRVEDVTLLGGYYGVELRGSLSNSFVDLRSGGNIRGFFAPTSVNQQRVIGERFNDISANANTFLNPVLEGGANGIRLGDAGEGSPYI